MPYNSQITEELNILVRYNLTTTQEGLKIHTSTAEAGVIEAAQRLFDKGLTSQMDGGYLTELGRQAAQHAQDLFLIMKS
ncbi:MAG: TIGR02647 family protein [Porticoccaceae bacterium]|nr:TIGR02647 family protein [Porticoccaceae bacterium]